MTSTTDQALAHRRRLTASFLVGWVAWYGFYTLQQTGWHEGFPFWVETTVVVAGVLGWVVFAYAVLRLVNLRKAYKDDPVGEAALEDELTKQNRAKANAFGIYVFIIVQIALVLFGDFLGWSAVTAAHVNIFSTVLAMLGAFFVLDMQE